MFIGTKGQKCKQCLRCRESVKKFKCPHNKQKSKCRDCKGVGICIHNNRKEKCKKCGGNELCIHNRDKRMCKECQGSGICIHNKEKYSCRDCGGQKICIHKREKRRCKYCNPLGHLRSIVKNRILYALKSKKSKGSLEYLGCDIEFYKTHIEKQFVEGMTWDNMGEWEIDHITPIMYKKPSIKEIVERLHWSNTQPLWKADNMAKGNRWIG